MPILTDLDERLEQPPFDVDAYQSRLPTTQTVANRVHLVHVSGVPDIANEWQAFISLVTEHPHEIPTSDHPFYCSEATRQAEDRLDLPRSVYFYAGRAHPDFGSVALAFAPHCEQGCSGSVTPFDTGGFVWQPTPHMKVNLEPDDELPQRVQYCKNSIIQLAHWRGEFARFLAAYFDEWETYWTGRPSRPDPEELFTLNTDWRCWTFEIRFAAPHPITNRVAWCADEGVMNELRRLHDKEPLTPGSPRPINDFLNNPAPLEPSGTPHYCKTIEDWIREQVQP